MRLSIELSRDRFEALGAIASGQNLSPEAVVGLLIETVVDHPEIIQEIHGARALADFPQLLCEAVAASEGKR